MAEEKEQEVPSNIHDLDEYRKQREAEGTWPPPPLTVREYWQTFLRERKTGRQAQ